MYFVVHVLFLRIKKIVREHIFSIFDFIINSIQGLLFINGSHSKILQDKHYIM